MPCAHARPHAGGSAPLEEVHIHPSSIAHGLPTAQFNAPFLAYLEKVCVWRGGVGVMGGDGGA